MGRASKIALVAVRGRSVVDGDIIGLGWFPDLDREVARSESSEFSVALSGATARDELLECEEENQKPMPTTPPRRIKKESQMRLR